MSSKLQLYFLGNSSGGERGYTPWKEEYCYIILWDIQVCVAVKGMVFMQLSLRYGLEITEFVSRIGYHFQGN